jgi:hypothetical protein
MASGGVAVNPEGPDRRDKIPLTCRFTLLAASDGTREPAQDAADPPLRDQLGPTAKAR